MKYRLNDEKVFSDVTDGIGILIEIESGIYYGLNLLTTNVYENIINGVDTEELRVALSKVKGFNEEIDRKYSLFLQDLISKEFIVENDAASSSASLSINEYSNNELDFVMTAYPDAAELLLADPIHQVKEELGWKPETGVLK